MPAILRMEKAGGGGTVGSPKDPFGEYNLHASKEWCAENWIRLPAVLLQDIGLSPYDKLVFVALLGHVHGKGHGKCNPKLDTLSAETALSKSQVRVSLRRLWNLGFVHWERTRGASFFRIFSPKEVELNQKRIAKVRQSVKKGAF